MQILFSAVFCLLLTFLIYKIGKHFSRIIIGFLAVAAVIQLIPNLFSKEELDIITITPPNKFDGALDPGDFALNKVERLFEGELIGPECLEQSPVEPDVFYASVQGGAIVKIFDNGKQMKPVAKLGGKCESYRDIKDCGRPLGIRFDKNGFLIAADYSRGIFQIDLTTGTTKTLVSKETLVDGRTGKIFNSVAPAKDGKIYYTVSSTNYPYDESLREMFGAASGRLMVYDPITQENRVLRENLHFPNGILLSPDEDYLVFSEFFRYRLLKYHLSGPKEGQTEIFSEGLPGCPDNLNLSQDGNIYVGFVSVRFPGQFNPVEFLYQYPWLRKVFLGFLHLIKAPFYLASKYSDLSFIHKVSFEIMSLELLKPFIPPYSIIMEISWEGKPLKSWHSSSSESHLFSDARVINGYMYLGSPYNEYVGRVKIPDTAPFV